MWGELFRFLRELMDSLRCVLVLSRLYSSQKKWFSLSSEVVHLFQCSCTVVYIIVVTRMYSYTHLSISLRSFELNSYFNRVKCFTNLTKLFPSLEGILTVIQVQTCNLISKMVQSSKYVLVVRRVCSYIHWSVFIFTNPSARAEYDTRSICWRSLTGMNSEFSFS